MGRTTYLCFFKKAQSVVLPNSPSLSVLPTFLLPARDSSLGADSQHTIISNREDLITIGRLYIAEPGEITERRQNRELPRKDKARQSLPLARGTVETNAGMNVA